MVVIMPPMIMPPVIMVMVMMPMVIMVMIMVMVVIMGHIQAAFARAEGGAKITIFDITARRRYAFAFHMVVMAFLRQADFIFKAQDLGAIFTHRTVHIVIAGQDFPHPISKGGDHLIMIVQIPGFDKFNIRMAGGNFIGEPVNPVNQNAGK